MKPRREEDDRGGCETERECRRGQREVLERAQAKNVSARRNYKMEKQNPHPALPSNYVGYVRQDDEKKNFGQSRWWTKIMLQF